MQSSDTHFINTIRDIILDTFEDSNYSIAFLCQSLYISRSQLHRRLKKITGLSTTHYVRKIRLEESAKLIAESDMSIGSVAMKVGINSPGNFTRYFKEEYGVTPSAYKAKLTALKSIISLTS